MQESAKSSLELVFLFTGWDYAREGRRATDFAGVCAALGVEFNLKSSRDRILQIQNAESHVKDISLQLESIIQNRALNRHDTLKLRGRLGFADSFLHGRLGPLVLKRLIDNAYNFSNVGDDELAHLLRLMLQRASALMRLTMVKIILEDLVGSLWTRMRSAALGSH